MANKIYIGKSNSYIDQYLANFIINKQPLFWDKIMYLISKA